MMKSMLRSPMQQRPKLEPGDPRLIATYRFQFYVYSVRHLLGIAFFSFLAVQAFRLATPIMGYVLGVFGLAYAGLVVFNMVKLFRAWKSNEAVRRERETLAKSI